MFSRSSEPAQQPVPEDPTAGRSAGGGPPPTPPTGGAAAPLPRSAAAQRTQTDVARSGMREDGVSVIGRDLAIIGEGLKIVTRGQIQIDGDVRGDVYGDQIVIGEGGSVDGVVAASRVVVRGTVNGTVQGRDVVLTSTAHVQADLHHASLSLEQGAIFEGRSRRAKEGQDLAPDLDAVAKGGEHDSGPAIEPAKPPPAL